MTQSSLQTQCPKCQTRFRVTDQQLGVAGGKVRCGNCMEVFNAIDHQIRPGAKSSATAQTSPATSTTSEEDFVFADNPEEDAEEGRYAGSKLTFSEDELSDSFRSIDEQSTADFKDADEPSEHEEVDESWAEAMLDEPEVPARRQTAPNPEPSPRPEEPPRQAPPQESFEPEPEPASSEPTTEAPSSPEPREPEFHVDRDQDRVGEPVRSGVPFGDLRTEPVAVDTRSGSGLRKILWSLVVLALIGVLVAQVTWFQFDRLSAIPELRPFYEKGCELAGCTLKPLVNVDAIQSRKLVVRTDPENRTQLLVDAVIINRASFEQPFPAIALTFSNLNGDVVAQSVFTPEEYIAGDAKELDTMPVNTPVRIAIRIRDPGRDAVNYNLSFRPYSP
ncbi:Zinc finger-domain-containing protein [Marinobacter santoriniensis NKSG1]|uniref:Zinc finger-domain-containing protein n=1 Tax=Marinobacter santoriniensis NKSG1 TaxID=1288826 RepID=M7DBY5_9GAMM|nr:DUF3426 domain-containing protein [Marinobacter santoriniensis]EMP55182.1 Zinc finger-domain-containing protein [Marinobacter santoriniensis NKSG1]